jgi:putative Mn2+ efflux pump MntP
METWALLVTAVALAIDAFTVAVASGLVLGTVDGRQTFRLSWHFGLFQSLMTFLGWAAGLTFRSLIEAVDHWVAFGLLLFVSARMLVHAVKGEDEDGKGKERKPKDPTKGASLVLLSVATSIDALAVGLSLSLLSVSIITPVIVIGVTALVLTAFGLHLGRFVTRTAGLGRAAEVLAALVLLAIGAHILHEHGVF